MLVKVSEECCTNYDIQEKDRESDDCSVVKDYGDICAVFQLMLAILIRC